MALTSITLPSRIFNLRDETFAFCPRQPGYLPNEHRRMCFLQLQKPDEYHDPQNRCGHWNSGIHGLGLAIARENTRTVQQSKLVAWSSPPCRRLTRVM